MIYLHKIFQNNKMYNVPFRKGGQNIARQSIEG